MMTHFPSLNPLFQRLAAAHPWWEFRLSCPVYDGLSEWRHDGGTCRDEGWMVAHLRLLRAVRNTVAGLEGFGYLHEAEFEDDVRRSQDPLQERWYVVYRGETISVPRDLEPYDPEESENAGDHEDDDQVEEQFVRFGEHRATGPTDLHAMLEALVLALEAHLAEGRPLVIDDTWRTYELREVLA